MHTKEREEQKEVCPAKKRGGKGKKKRPFAEKEGAVLFQMRWPKSGRREEKSRLSTPLCGVQYYWYHEL